MVGYQTRDAYQAYLNGGVRLPQENLPPLAVNQVRITFKVCQNRLLIVYSMAFHSLYLAKFFVASAMIMARSAAA